MLWLERVTTGNFCNHFGWCYIALQPVVTGFGFFRQLAKQDQISVKQREAPVVLFGLILNSFSKWKPLVQYTKAPVED